MSNDQPLSPENTELLRSISTRRAILASVFAGGTLTAFAAYLIALVVSRPQLAAPVANGSRITIAIALSVGFLVAIVAITALYTVLAGRLLDPLIRRLRGEFYGS